VSVWDFQSFREKSLTPAHEGPVTALAISPNGRLLATVGQDHWLKLWDVARVQPKLLDKQEADEFQADAVAFHPDSRVVVTGGADRRIRFWKVSDGKLSNSVLLRTDAPVYCLAFDPKGKFLVSAGRDKAVRLWDPTGKSTEPLAVWTEHSDYVSSVACSPLGNLVRQPGETDQLFCGPSWGRNAGSRIA
jgi:WD40 repeat protein